MVIQKIIVTRNHLDVRFCMRLTTFDESAVSNAARTSSPRPPVEGELIALEIFVRFTTRKKNKGVVQVAHKLNCQLNIASTANEYVIRDDIFPMIWQDN